jgi:hypothetical protein
MISALGAGGRADGQRFRPFRDQVIPVSERLSNI